MKKIIILPARILFALQFLTAMDTLFGNKAVQGAAASGFPFPELTAKIAALTALSGSVSIILGYKAKIGGLLIAAFLIPVTFSMHAYWNIDEPAMRIQQSISFYKNINAIGGAMIISYFGSGPFSIDSMLKKNRS
ncbi:DoxX family protein [Flavobacterium sp.]|uniref:DoxX family protein n=1 Tax=Flavobacterium sp. TaxID=239 RepID=UPI002ED87152